MPHDNAGRALKVGDRVMVPCRVKAIHLGEDYCNVDLETEHRMYPSPAPSYLVLNSRQVELRSSSAHAELQRRAAADPKGADSFQDDRDEWWVHESVAKAMLGQGRNTALAEAEKRIAALAPDEDKIHDLYEEVNWDNAPYFKDGWREAIRAAVESLPSRIPAPPADAPRADTGTKREKRRRGRA